MEEGMSKLFIQHPKTKAEESNRKTDAQAKPGRFLLHAY